MSNDKDQGRLSVLFSKYITGVAAILWLLFLGIAVAFLVLDIWGNTGRAPIVCFLKEWKTVFLAASVCVWGFTLTCVIFLLGRLEDVYYGTSLKRIVIMCFGKKIVIAYVVLYIILVPLMIVFYYTKMWFINAWFQVINYAYSAGLILFISMISVRSTVIELIRDRTVKLLEGKNFDENGYNDERLAILNMIRKLNYDDAWQCDRLQSIVADMSVVAIEKNRVYGLYNVIQLIIQHAGYKMREDRNRIVNMLNNINQSIIGGKYKRDIEDLSLRINEAVAMTILPILQVEVDGADGKWISQLINKLHLSVRKDVIIMLMFGAEYLRDCGVYYESTVNEIFDTYMELMDATIQKEKLLNEIQALWLSLNLYNHQGVAGEELCEEFVEDYANIDERVCTTKILLDLQTKKFEKMGK